MAIMAIGINIIYYRMDSEFSMVGLTMIKRRMVYPLLICMLLVYFTTPSVLSWYLPDYPYRSILQINNSYTDSWTNYPVNVTINTTEPKYNCSQMRIVDERSNSSVSWYNASSCNSSATVIWFRANITASSSNINYSIYYGSVGRTDARTNATDVRGILKDGSAVLIYNLNELSGNLKSTGGVVNDLVMTSMTNGTNCMLDSCKSFDGTSGYAQGNVYNLTPGGVNTNFTIETYMRVGTFTAGVNTEAISRRNPDQSGGFHLGTQSSANQFRWLGFDTDYRQNNFNNNTRQVNRWYHILVTLNGSGYNLFVDGLPDGVIARGGAFADGSNAAVLMLGSEAGGSAKFNGTLDEIGIFNRSLSLVEIRHHSQYYLMNSSYGNELSLCNPSWSCSAYGSCQSNNVSNCTSVTDSNNCGIAYAGNYSEFQQACIYCAPSWTCSGYFPCNETDTRNCSSVHDDNNCDIPYSGNWSEFTPLVCDFCSPAWTCFAYSNETCATTNVLNCTSVNDTNSCYAQTGLMSDFFNGTFSDYNSDCPYTPTLLSFDLSSTSGVLFFGLMFMVWLATSIIGLKNLIVGMFALVFGVVLGLTMISLSALWGLIVFLFTGVFFINSVYKR